MDLISVLVLGGVILVAAAIVSGRNCAVAPQPALPQPTVLTVRSMSPEGSYDMSLLLLPRLTAGGQAEWQVTHLSSGSLSEMKAR